MSTRFSRGARRLAALGIVGLVAFVGSAVGTYAGHRFSDVPNDHPFHAEIDWLAQKGITLGFNDGTYRPGEPVTRMAMAAFMQRQAVGSPMEWEPNNSIYAADILRQQDNGPNSRLAHSMGMVHSTDADYWRLLHPGGGYLSATTHGLDCSDQNLSNIDLTLYDASGAEVTQGNNDEFGDFCAALFIQPLNAGIYFLRVSTTGFVPWYGLNVMVTNYET